MLVRVMVVTTRYKEKHDSEKESLLVFYVSNGLWMSWFALEVGGGVVVWAFYVFYG